MLKELGKQTNRSDRQTNELFKLVRSTQFLYKLFCILKVVSFGKMKFNVPFDKTFKRLCKLETKMKNSFYRNCPSTKEEVENALSLNPKSTWFKLNF